MTDTLEQRWRISEDAIAKPVGCETVILHLGNGTYYGLDEIGSLLWEGIKDGERPAEICAAILERYDVDQSTLESDMRRFLGELRDNDLVMTA